MTYEGWLTVGVVAMLLVALLRNLAPTDILFVAATTLFAATGIISADEAFAGFSNSGVLTVGFLFVVVAGLRETGVLDQVGHHLLGNAKTQRGALMRLSTVVVPMSAFLNNTPIVAMFVPIVMDWCRRHRDSPSRLLIPLSYLTILGGTCTLIGTSTNLVVDGLLKQNGLPGLSLWELGQVGVPYAVVGAGYLYLGLPQNLWVDSVDIRAEEQRGARSSFGTLQNGAAPFASPSHRPQLLTQANVTATRKGLDNRVT